MKAGDRVKSKKDGVTGTIKRLHGDVATIKRDPEYAEPSYLSRVVVDVWVSHIENWEILEAAA